MARHLLMRLEAPLMAFGTVAVDHRRPVQPWPAPSLLTGLLANALGYRRIDAAALERLQARLRWAARIDRPGELLHDFQTAQLSQGDRGWTTRGVVEERAGGAASYDSPHLRSRDYRADASVLVALRLEPVDEPPTIEQLAAALDAPARPLFLGRKGCLPATRIGQGLVDAGHAVDALAHGPAVADGMAADAAAVYFADGDVPDACGPMVHRTSGERRFDLDVHAGWQLVRERPARALP